MKIEHLILYKYSLEIIEFDEHAQSGLRGAPLSDLPALIEQYTEKGALLHLNLYNCFDCTLHGRGALLYLNYFKVNFIQGSTLFQPWSF